MAGSLIENDAKIAADLLQQVRTITQLKIDGWTVIDRPPEEINDGQVLMQLTTSKGTSHILIMRDGERVDERQRLGKQPAQPTAGKP